MPTLKTINEAEKYGRDHYLVPELTETIHGSWKVKEGYGKKIHKPNGG